MATGKETKSDLTAEWLRANLTYDHATGVFMWKTRGFGRRMGRSLGTICDGYLTMKVRGTVYYAHRLAWLFVHGEWPNGLLDHRDDNRSNNAIGNLRVATSAENAARRPARRTIAPSRGVFPHGVGFVARIHHAGKRHYLGYFSTLAAATAAYEAKAKEIHGEFAYVEKSSMLAYPVSLAELNRGGLFSGALGFGA